MNPTEQNDGQGNGSGITKVNRQRHGSGYRVATEQAIDKTTGKAGVTTTIVVVGRPRNQDNSQQYQSNAFWPVHRTKMGGRNHSKICQELFVAVHACRQSSLTEETTIYYMKHLQTCRLVTVKV